MGIDNIPLWGRRDKPTVDFNLTSALPTVLTHSRAGNATMYDSTGTLVWAPANMCHPSVPNNNWVNTNTSSQYNIETAPDGSSTAGKFQDNSTSGIHYFRNVGDITVVVGQSYTSSFYAKAGTAKIIQIIFSTANFSTDSYANFDLENGILGSVGSAATAAIESEGNGWYRCSVTGVATVAGTNISPGYVFVNNIATSARLPSYVGSGQYIYVWGAMFENTSYNSPQPYIATTSAAYYGPRFDHDPSTLALRGLLMEESRQNNILNNTMVGAVTGSPGTLPSGGWATVLAGLTQTIVGTGTDNGKRYIDLRFSGTTTGTSIVVRYCSSTKPPLAAGSAGTLSGFYSIVGGGLTNVTSVKQAWDEFNGGTYVTSKTGSAITLTSSLVRKSDTFTANATVTNVNPYLILTVNNSSAVDITIRIALPQEETGSFATSVIPTYGATATRAADIPPYATLSALGINPDEGTMIVDAMVPYSIPATRSYFAGMDDGTGDNVIAAFIETDGKPIGGNAIGGVVTLSGDALDVTTPYTNISAVRTWKNADHQFKANNVIDGDGTMRATAVPVVTTFRVGGGIIANRELNGWVRRVRVWRTANINRS